MLDPHWASMPGFASRIVSTAFWLGESSHWWVVSLSIEHSLYNLVFKKFLLVKYKKAASLDTLKMCNLPHD